MKGEQRQVPRRKLEFPARIDAAQMTGPVVCAVVDISERGAQLRVAHTDFPKVFNLLLSRDGKINRQCQVVWKDGTRVGVEFLERGA